MTFNRDVVLTDLAGAFSKVALPSFPEGADIDAYQLLPSGELLVSFDTFVVFGGVSLFPGDVGRYDGAAWSVAFRASDQGLPAGANLDAVTAEADGSLLLSFDTSLALGTGLIQDEDLVRVTPDGLEVVFDGSAAGVPPELNLVAAHRLVGNNHLLLVFDGPLLAGGTVQPAGTILEYAPESNTWELAVAAAQLIPPDSGSRIDALDARAVDNDGDGVGAADCNDDNRNVWALPSEVQSLLLTHAGGAGDQTTLHWSSPALPGGSVVAYDVLSSQRPDDFLSALCVESGDGTDQSAVDATALPPGGCLYFLVRAVNACGGGTLGFGQGTGGAERSGRSCP